MNKLRAISPALYDHKWLKIVVGLIIVCILSPISISAGPIPITLQTFILFTITAVLGKNEGTIIAILYLIIGALGAPVFSDYSSGWEKFSGLTAGFLYAFPLCCYLLGEMLERQAKSVYLIIFNFLIAHIVLLIFGFGYMILFAEVYSFAFGSILPLLPGLIIKSVAGGVITFWYTTSHRKLKS